MQHQIKLNNQFLTQDHEAIVALCTPRGSGAIALIRISGVNALEVVSAMTRLTSGELLCTVDSHTIHHGYVIDDQGTVVDEVMFLVMHGPRTFTGQDTVEITCHNNHFIIERILECAIKQGARNARSGEFTKRAFLNGKVDLVQAEAINELIHAQSEVSLRQSLATLRGSFSESMQRVEKTIIHLLGYVEASFEFLDEEQRDFDFGREVLRQIHQILNEVKDLRELFSAQKQIKDGVRVALLGMVNVGKSTLFNALAKQERAIVTEIAGTTRDSIETSLYKNGNFWLLIDTAGIRNTTDVVEQKGIERSFAEAAAADIVLLVIDATTQLNREQAEQYIKFVQDYQDKVIVVINKIDNPYDGACIPAMLIQHPSVQKVSAKHAHGVGALEEAIESKIQQLFAHLKSPFLINQRQFKLLTEIQVKLEFIANGYCDGIHYELVAYQLKELLEHIAELTGKNVSERVLDAVFNEFCIGK